MSSLLPERDANIRPLLLGKKRTYWHLSQLQYLASARLKKWQGNCNAEWDRFGHPSLKNCLLLVIQVDSFLLAVYQNDRVPTIMLGIQRFAPVYQTISRKENLFSLAGFSKTNRLTRSNDGLMSRGTWHVRKISVHCQFLASALGTLWLFTGRPRCIWFFRTSLRNLLFIIACNDCF